MSAEGSSDGHHCISGNAGVGRVEVGMELRCWIIVCAYLPLNLVMKSLCCASKSNVQACVAVRLHMQF